MSLTKVTNSMISGAPGSILDAGATTGAADNTTAIGIALTNNSVVDVPVGNFAVTTLTVPANKILQGFGYLSSLTGQLVAGAKSVIRKLTISNASTIPLQLTVGADDVVFDEITTATGGYASTFLLDGSNNLTVRNSVISADGYSILTNNGTFVTPAASSKIRIQDNYLSSIDADGIELNHPNAAVTGNIVTGNFIETTGTSSGSTAGFAFGNSNSRQWIFNSNIILDSRMEAVHIEAGQTGGTVVGNSIKSRAHGILLYGSLGTPGAAVPVIGNNLLSPAFTVISGLNNSGLFNSYASPVGPLNGVPIVGNVVEGFSVGMFLRGPLDQGIPTITLADNNSFKSSAIGIKLEGTNAAKNRQFGVSYVEDTPILASATIRGSCSFGKVYTNATPTTIMDRDYADYIPPCIDGFGYPIPSTTANAISDLFAATSGHRFFGRVRVEFTRTGVLDWLYASANVHWDGTTLTTTNLIWRGAGPTGTWSAPTFSVSANVFKVFPNSTVGMALQNNWMEFDGEYYIP